MIRDSIFFKKNIIVTTESLFEQIFHSVLNIFKLNLYICGE